MQDAEGGVVVGRERAVEGIVGLCANEHVIVGKARDDQRVIESSFLVGKLNDVAELDVAALTRVGGIGTDTAVSFDKLWRADQKAVELIDPRPRGCAVVGRAVVPPKGRRKIHHAAPRKQTLGNKVGAVSALTRKVDKKRIARERPALGVFDGARTVVWNVQ